MCPAVYFVWTDPKQALMLSMSTLAYVCFSKIRFFEAELEFRNSFVYSNLMYDLATYISERLAGRSWEDLLQDEIFKPLNMTSTTFTHVANLSRPDIAKPYLPDGTSWRAVSLLLHR